MPADWKSPAVVNLSDAINLLAKYQPNRGKDIADLGAAITKQANMYPLQIHAQAEAQAKVAEANKKNQEMFDALRLSNYMRENRDQIDAILKTSFNGSEGYASVIDNPTIDAFAKDAILKRAAEQLGIGDTSRERAAKAEEAKLRGQEALATIGYRNLQTENERLKLAEAQREEADKAAEARFMAGIVDPANWPDLEAATSGEGEASMRGGYNLARKFGYSNPFKIFGSIKKLQEIKPPNTKAYADIKTGLDLAEAEAQATANSTPMAGGLTYQDASNIRRNGLKEIPRGVAKDNWDKLLKNGAYVDQARRTYEEVIKEHPEYADYLTPDMAVYLGAYYLPRSRWYEYFTPGTTSLGNGSHINTSNLEFGEDTIEGQRGSLKGALMETAKSLSEHQREIRALDSTTGIFPVMRKIVEDIMTTEGTSNFNPIKNTSTKEGILNKALPKLRQALKDAGYTTKEEQDSILIPYLSRLQGSPASFSFIKQN